MKTVNNTKVDKGLYKMVKRQVKRHLQDSRKSLRTRHRHVFAQILHNVLVFLCHIGLQNTLTLDLSKGGNQEVN